MHGIELIVAAAGVGFGHAVLPDHWLPLAVMGRTQKRPLPQVARLSAVAGFAHVMVSVILGALVIVVGLQFRHTVEHAQNLIVGGLLIATGIGFIVLELTGHGHHHGAGEHVHSHSLAHDHSHDHGHDHSHEHHDHSHTHNEHSHAPSRISVLVPFGAAASPDLTILPVFLAATAVSVTASIASVVVFALVTIATFVTLTLIVAGGGYQLKGDWLERWGNAITAAVLLVIGGLVISGLI